jgi:hypothetical protein
MPLAASLVKKAPLAQNVVESRIINPIIAFNTPLLASACRNKILGIEKPSKSSLDTRNDNSSIRKNNRIEFLTGFSFLKRYQPMSDGLRPEPTLHGP